MPAAVDSLVRLGVEPPPGLSFRGIRIKAGKRSAEGYFKRGHGLCVRRTDLSRALRNRAEVAGVEFIAERARTLRQDDAGVDLNGGSIRATWMIAADGLHSAVARLVGAARRTGRNPRWGVRAHFATRPWSDMVEIRYSASGEAYIAPVSETSVGVAILSSRPGHFDEQIRAYPELRARLGEWLGPEKGAGPFPQWLDRRVYGRILFAGDAAGFLDPLTGEGVQLGLNAARLAVDAIAARQPERYDTAWWRMTRSYWWMTSLILGIRRSHMLDRLFVPLLDLTPGLFDGALQLLGGVRPRRRQAEDETGGSVIRKVVPDPVHHDTGAIPEAN